MIASDALRSALADRYTLLRELGSGGMATVYLAEDARHHRHVAIKVLHPELSAAIGSKRFLKEIETIGKLQHPHIMPLFDSGSAGDVLYFVMPFVEGETLRSRLDREQLLPVNDAINLSREVADALAYAHARGVIHRDIKPENILLHDGHALLADFGIALAVEQAAGDRLTQTGLSVGTPHYMSPEQAMAERTVDARSDIYALGAVTYEMLTGEPPFSGPTAQAIIARVMTEKPRNLRDVRDAVTPALEAVVLTALARLPADRFASATAYADALERAKLARPDDPQIANGAHRARPQYWLIAAMLIGGAALGILGARVFNRTSRLARAGEPQFLSIALPDSAPYVVGLDYTGVPVGSLALSSDGRRLVYASSDSHTSALWEVRLDNGSVRNLPSTEGAILPALSPDNRSLAFVIDTQVRRLDLDDAKVSRIGTFPFVNLVSWTAPDRLIVGAAFSCLRSVSVASGAADPYPRGQCAGAEALTHIDATGSATLLSNDSLLVTDDATGITRTVRRATIDSTDSRSLVRGHSAFLLGDSVLVFSLDSTMYAAPFNARTARVVAEPRAIASGIRYDTFGSAGYTAYSASGTLVLVTGTHASASRFVWVTRNGRVEDTVPIRATVVGSYALSPDGRRLAFATNTLADQVLRIADLKRNVVDTAVFSPGFGPTRWINGGRDLTGVVGIRDGKFQYSVVRIDGARITQDRTGASMHGDTRDGKRACIDGLFWSVATPADSVRFDAQDEWCTFSPDGTQIAWVASGGIYVAPVIASARESRRLLAQVGDEPQWSADGREIIFRERNAWYAVDARTRTAGRPPAPTLLFRGTFEQAKASWALGPDGRLLLLQSPPPSRVTHLNVITHFPEYVAQKLRSQR